MSDLTKISVLHNLQRIYFIISEFLSCLSSICSILHFVCAICVFTVVCSNEIMLSLSPGLLSLITIQLWYLVLDIWVGVWVFVINNTLNWEVLIVCEYYYWIVCGNKVGAVSGNENLPTLWSPNIKARG